MIFKPRRENAPDFIKGGLSIKVDDFIAFLQKYKKADGWINVDICQSQGGKLYTSLNTFEPKKQEDVSDSVPF
jgi:hypothetical protein